MDTSILLIILVIGLIVIVLIILGRRQIKRGAYPYQRQEALFTPAERSFFYALLQATGRQFVVLAKVRMADVIRVRKGLPRSGWQGAFNRISGKHLDFVLCDRKTLAASTRFASASV